jgi:hypothetical protein
VQKKKYQNTDNKTLVLNRTLLSKPTNHIQHHIPDHYHRFFQNPKTIGQVADHQNCHPLSLDRGD